jgi:hypothetical protein
MSKKYKIVLSDVDYGSGLMPLFQVREQLDAAKRDFELDPKGYKEKIDELESRLRDYDIVVKQIASILGIDTITAESMFKDIIDRYKLGIPSAIAAFKTIGQAASPMGLQGEDLLDFIEIYLNKTTDLVRVAPKIASDLNKINELSKELEILPVAMLGMFKDSLMSDNFDNIYNLVAIAPLLKIDFKTIGVKQISGTALITKAVSIVQDVSQVNLDLSTKASLLEGLVKSQHKVENAYNEILMRLDKTEIDRSKEFNESLAKDIELNPDYYFSLNNYHMKQTGKYKRIRDVYDIVNKKSLQAPGDYTKPVVNKSFINRKIRIITAQAGQMSLQSSYTQIEVSYSKLVNKLTLMKKEKLLIDNYLRPVEKTGETLEIITSDQNFLDTKSSISKFGRLLSDAENLINDIRTKLDYFINNVPFSAGDIAEKAKQAKNDIDTAKEAELEQYRIDFNRYKLIMPILDDLKFLDDKIALYNQYKEDIKPKSAKFRVKFDFVDPRTGDVTNTTMPRYSFINWVYHIGLDIVSKISSIANRYMGVGGEAGRRSAIRLNKEALKFKTENQNWAESNMDVQAPLVEEFRR